MSLAGWYFHKAEQCADMAKMANTPTQRAHYKHEQMLWLEIAAKVVSDEEVRLGAMSK